VGHGSQQISILRGQHGGGHGGGGGGQHSVSVVVVTSVVTVVDDLRPHEPDDELNDELAEKLKLIFAWFLFSLFSE